MTYRLVIPATVLLLYAALAALWHRGPHSAYFTILRLFGFEPFRFPFLDIYAVLAAVQCRHLGIDVYSINPCDALGRPHVYSPLWLRVVPGFFNTSWTTICGITLGLVFIMSLAALCRPVSRREVLLMALVAISPMTVYALERANNDLVVFLLTVVSVALIRTRRTARWSGYALFLFAGLLKYYPLVLLAMIAREQRRDAIGFAAIALTILAVLVICNRAEIAAALAIIPKPSYFADSFAAANLAFGLGEILAFPFARGIAASLLAILAMVTGARILRLVHVIDQARIDWTTFAADCLIAGALLLTACFFAAQNVYYRGVYFVLIMPGLLQLRRGAATGEAHRLLSLVLAAIIFVTWEEPLHRSVHLVAASLRFGSVGPRIEVLYWLARELVWWWLIASLAAIALCYMWRQPLIAEALPELARSLRRHR
jgi:hypothetical protein